MLNEKDIIKAFLEAKNIIYIIKDESENIIEPKDKDTLKLYSEIIKSKVKSDNQFYHKKNKQWYQLITTDVEKNNKKYILDFLEDITSIKKRERKLKIDSLTNLMKDRNDCNKMINEYIEYAINNKEEFSIVIADIDSFKMINDTYGHDCGDFALKTLGPLLLKNTRQSNDQFDYRNSDIVMRYGGDEFLILLKNISLEDTKKKINDFNKTIKNKKFNYDHRDIPLTMSFGYCHVLKVENSKKSIDEIRQETSKKADEYLYAIKANKKSANKRKK